MGKDIYVLIEHLRGQVMDISYVMLAAARPMAAATGGQVVALLLGSGAQSLANDLAADRVLYMDSPAFADFTSEAYQRALTGVLQTGSPRAAIFGDTSIGGEVAGWLAAHLGLPLVSACRRVEPENGSLRFVSQICGGKIMAEGVLPEPTALVTMVPGGFKPEQGRAPQAPPVEIIPAPALGDLRMTVKGYFEPAAGDVDIAKERVLVSVGRGIQNRDNIELAEELAKALGGVVCGSRPVVDQEWLPMTRLVGKSGKTVKPKLYLALGISGAPEHVEAVADSEMIIAVNSDADAPIYNLARYGAQVDVLELMPVLTEKVQQAK
ncbi:MAG: electron transfer flavoprotein subunit alpha/FixB family protein [Chloroflexi bacterium]|nr:electron transfer flavoprotein subunit alpha/FixB family protein [Chloroflexota bacterium]